MLRRLLRFYASAQQLGILSFIFWPRLLVLCASLSFNTCYGASEGLTFANSESKSETTAQFDEAVEAQLETALSDDADAEFEPAAVLQDDKEGSALEPTEVVEQFPEFEIAPYDLDMVTVRRPGEVVFDALKGFDERIHPGTGIKILSSFEFPTASPCMLLFSAQVGSESVVILEQPPFELEDSQTLLRVFPGSLCEIQSYGLRLLLGRVEIQKGSELREFRVSVSRADFFLAAGDAVAERHPDGNSFFAVRKGSGWIKERSRAIIRLNPGRQIAVPRFGGIGRPVAISSQWVSPPKVFGHVDDPTLRLIHRAKPVPVIATKSVEIFFDRPIPTDPGAEYPPERKKTDSPDEQTEPDEGEVSDDDADGKGSSADPDRNSSDPGNPAIFGQPSTPHQ